MGSGIEGIFRCLLSRMAYCGIFPSTLDTGASQSTGNKVNGDAKGLV